MSALRHLDLADATDQRPELAPVPPPPISRRGWRRPKDRKVTAIAAAAPFAACRADDLVALARAGELVRLDEGDVLATDADPARWWWCPMEGALQACREDGAVTLVTTGQAAGLAERRTPPRRVTVTARRDSVVLVCRRTELLALMSSRPRIAAAVRSSLSPTTR
jgi:CRP-like cAMP-binding protein